MPEQKRTYQWQVPKFEAAPEDRMAWVEDMLKEASNYQNNNDFYSRLQQDLKIYNGVFSDGTKSTLITNDLKTSIRKFVQAVSEVKEIGTYGTNMKAFKPYAQMLNAAVKNIYIESDFPTQVRRAVQYAAVMRRGYLWVITSADDYGWGKRRLKFVPLGPLDVVDFQTGQSHNVQDAYAVTVYDYMPVAEAFGRFPKFESELQVVSAARYSNQLEARRADVASRLRYAGDNQTFGDTNCEIRYTYVRDLRVNDPERGGYKKEIEMGEPGTSWFYRVPYLGQKDAVVDGIGPDGRKKMRVATLQDARIYPHLRLMITSKGMTRPMYDGPAFSWHGKIPVVQYQIDDEPWQEIGNSIVQEVGSVQTTIRKIERKVDNVITVTLNPPLGYDRGQTGGPAIENFDIFEQDKRTGVDGKPRDVLQSMLPETVRVENMHFEELKYLKDVMKSMLGLDDLQALAKLKQNVANDAVQKALEDVGPLGLAIASNVENANMRIAEMVPSEIVQFYDTARIMKKVGDDKLAPEIFDFDPTSLVPSHAPEEKIRGRIPAVSAYDKIERAKRLLSNIELVSVPSTIIRLTAQQEQLKYLQLKRSQAPISWCTVMKKMDVENYGDVPGDTEREKYLNEEKEMLKMKAEVMQYAQSLGLGGDPNQGGGQKQHAGGRPPSGKKPPQIKQKGGPSGPRTTVTES